ncbi:MAG: tRNA (adenosine(37)-N6)-threonylcarbamoyltransferase complex dimerization subunit type 1 TsaB [Sphingomicrobium sp.]
MTTIAPMLLAFDSSSAACTAALFDGSGECVGKTDELLGRGHAERLVPMLAELLDGRAATHILVGVGPGSFTGIRVAIAAAQGLAIGWDAALSGMSSLALLAAGAGAPREVAAAIQGGHGELFVQQFDELMPTSEVRNASPSDAARLITAQLVVGSGAKQLVELRGRGDALELWPSAANALRIPEPIRTLPPKPVYARLPDAKVPEAA